MKNIDMVVNDIIREAFTSGDRENTTPNSNGLSDKGGTARQMLSGEWFGSVAWPFDQATSKDYEGSVDLQLDQSQQGQGELVGGATVANESIGRELVDSLLEDSPSYLYSDPTTVGYLVNSLKESSLDDVASLVEQVCDNPILENIDKLLEAAKDLNNSDSDPYFIESLISLATFLIQEEDDIEASLSDGSQEEEGSDSSDETEDK